MKEFAWELGETSRMIRRVFDREVASLGITSAQWRVLLRINREPGLKQVELADRLDVEPITACRMVDRLEEAGLLERQRDPEDRRAWRLALTPKALPVVERLKALAEDLSVMAFEGLTQEQVDQVRGVLARVRDNVARAEQAQKVSA